MHRLLILLAVLAPSIAGARSHLERRDLDPDWVNQPSGFFRRGYLSSIIVGDYLYLDGGVIWNETGSIPIKSTYSLRLADSWDPREVQFKRIDKGDAAPVYNNPNLWLQTDNSSFFSFNGDIAGEWADARTPKDAPELWRFTPDGHGSGTWNLLSTVQNLAQSVNAAVATSQGVAYFLGGQQSCATSPNIASCAEYLSSDGLVSYTMASQTWKNQSIADVLPNGYTWDSQLHNLVGIGHGELFLSMGGRTTTSGPSLDGQDSIPYNTVKIWNSVTDQWRNQSTTGDIPQGRLHSCSVGLPGDNGTFEIFLYGGVHDIYLDTESEFNEEMGRSIYVLSLPSFHWHKSSHPEQQVRATHTCVVAARRQMLVVGGLQEGIAIAAGGADPWPQGLGIYDLTEMTWNSSYKSDALPYVTPRPVKDYIAINGSYPRQWNDETTEQWIKGTTATGTGPPTTSTAAHHSSSKTPEIVGGVVGSVGGILLLSALLWFILRRRRRRTRAARQEQEDYRKSELEDNSEASQHLYVSNKANYSDATNHPSELSGVSRHEMEGSSGAYELSSVDRGGNVH